ncbi:MAG TPA: FAD-binding oxidoreductase [Candidatus Sulfotelmatobacter sp.]|nr:FAD-binding oxidoreductase [Candidatus Sulfotelmatobacter sp.]
MAAPADKFHSARVTSRREIAADLWIIRLDPGGEFNFVAGQYATLGVRGEQKHSERAYSIASSPYEAELEIFIELVLGGELTPQLHKVQVGGEVTLRKTAKGRFTLDLPSGRKNHLLLCTVTGIAPFISYTRTLYKDWKEKRFPADLRLHIIDGASRSWELGYREEIQRVAAEVPWLTYVPTVSRPWEDPDWRGEVGRIEDVLRKYADLWQLAPADTTAYLCGHPEMIERGKGILKRRGFAREQMKEEVYWIPAKENTA